MSELSLNTVAPGENVRNGHGRLAHSEILSTSTHKESSSWDRLLKVQTDIFLPFELDYFFASKSWGKAQRVLDLGCGNGYYLSQLKRYFPKKDFVGIDISPELIEISRHKNSDQDITFTCADLFSYCCEPKFDVIIMRLVLQHMAGIEPVLEKISQLLSPSGSLIIIEPDVENLRNDPPTPKFDAMLQKVEAFSQSRNGNRANLSHLSTALSSIEGWKVEDDLRVSVPNTGPFTGTNYLQMFLLWVEIWQQSKAIETDFQAIRNELKTWASEPTCFSRIGFQVLDLQNKNSLADYVSSKRDSREKNQ